MKKYLASVNVMLRSEILDPQGKAVTAGLKNLGLKEIDNVRVGKHIVFEVMAASEDAAKGVVETACEKLLANLVMESFSFELTAV